MSNIPDHDRSSPRTLSLIILKFPLLSNVSWNKILLIISTLLYSLHIMLKVEFNSDVIGSLIMNKDLSSHDCLSSHLKSSFAPHLPRI